MSELLDPSTIAMVQAIDFEAIEITLKVNTIREYDIRGSHQDEIPPIGYDIMLIDQKTKLHSSMKLVKEHVRLLEIGTGDLMKICVFSHQGQCPDYGVNAVAVNCMLASIVSLDYLENLTAFDLNEWWKPLPPIATITYVITKVQACFVCKSPLPARLDLGLPMILAKRLTIKKGDRASVLMSKSPAV